ncbi:DUF924-domain-containing protein [Mytilinidion resinicola]|uniref:DUF924-domain-containing protein n=1 Tax=Mytilinidion resinicola TaxID=574789 RepID=A0A6A6YAY4_9PEZI|nr:DUF924-domain-containing protein [Mytilinidion resinicola]KAF2805986.1 DUF924-domain-containing protein [Mytilinidion resinicola]
MSTPRAFTLSKEIFNPSLYKLVQSTWFGGLPEGARAPTMEVAKKWWGNGVPPEEKAAFDTICRSNFLSALESIGPEKYPLSQVPSSAIAEPFLREISEQSPQDEGAESASESASTALSLILILDQMPRNILRTPSTLPLVYNHYDTIATAVMASLLSPNSTMPRLDKHPLYRLSSAHRFWFYMPHMHSESRELHKQLAGVLDEFRSELVEAGAECEASLGYFDRAANFEKIHAKIIERFGRYPYRNEVLGRESTEEEAKYLADGGETFGVGKKG